jgi:Tfp pilus assembly protein PilP
MHGDHVRLDRAEEGSRAGRDDGDKDSVAVQTTLRVFRLAVLLAALMAPIVSAAQSSQAKSAAAPPAASAPAPVTAPAATNTPAPASAPTPANASASGNAAAPAPASAATPLEPQGYTYDPQGRRDPFISLLRRGSDVPRVAGGNRPNGLAGLETGEVTLKGTIATQGTYVGILQGSDNKTYIVRAGDKLLDGTIRVINPESMVIAQQVTDPLSLEKQREVRKVLRQTEEGK